MLVQDAVFSASAPFGGRLVNDDGGYKAQALEANVDTLRTRRKYCESLCDNGLR
jgi:hypothetical protein